MFNVFYSEDSLIDLKEIADFISQDNPFYANKVIDIIYDSIEKLEIFPLLWKERKENLREIIDPKYWFRIIYELNTESKIINIISIFKYKNNW